MNVTERRPPWSASGGVRGTCSLAPSSSAPALSFAGGTVRPGTSGSRSGYVSERVAGHDHRWKVEPERCRQKLEALFGACQPAAAYQDAIRKASGLTYLDLQDDRTQRADQREPSPRSFQPARPLTAQPSKPQQPVHDLRGASHVPRPRIEQSSSEKLNLRSTMPLLRKAGLVQSFIARSGRALRRTPVEVLETRILRGQVRTSAVEGKEAREKTSPQMQNARATRQGTVQRLHALQSEACAFDGRQTRRCEHALRVDQELCRIHTSAPQMSLAFSRAIYNITSNRFVAPERGTLAAAPRKKDQYRRRKVQASAGVEEKTAEKNIWLPRAKWCDSGTLYDTEECEFRRFNTDWTRAMRLGIGKTIEKRDDDGALDGDGDGMSDEVAEVKSVLWDWHDLCVLLFNFYAAMNSDVHFISFNEWSSFVDDFNIDDPNSKLCRNADLDTIFIAVNAKSRLLEQGAKKTSGAESKQLDRVEFFIALIHVAINKYVLSGVLKDVSEAVHRLMSACIRPKADSKQFIDYDVFRKAAYRKEVNLILVTHENSLRAMFDVACGGLPGVEGQLLNIDEWLALLNALDIIGPDVSRRDAVLCFSASRMAVADGTTTKGRLKETNLPFEGFLEALCRLSTLKAWPTEDEIQLSGQPDVGLFFLRWQTDHFGDLKTFQAQRSNEWGEESCMNVLERLVEYTVIYIIRTIEDQIQQLIPDGALTESEARRWASKRGLIKSTGQSRKPRAER